VVHQEDEGPEDPGFRGVGSHLLLRELWFEHSAYFTDEALAHLSGLRHLETLYLHGSLTDRGVVHLANLTSLKTLYLHNPAVSDAGLSFLRDLTNLESLMIYGTTVAGPGLIHLRALSKLKHLSLGAPLTDDGLAYLPPLASLERVELSDVEATSVGLAYLAKLPATTQIEVIGPRASATDAATLRLLFGERMKIAGY
jgi:hypothetical protein